MGNVRYCKSISHMHTELLLYLQSALNLELNIVSNAPCIPVWVFFLTSSFKKFFSNFSKIRRLMSSVRASNLGADLHTGWWNWNLLRDKLTYYWFWPLWALLTKTKLYLSTFDIWHGMAHRSCAQSRGSIPEGTRRGSGLLSERRWDLEHSSGSCPPHLWCTHRNSGHTSHTALWPCFHSNYRIDD